MKRSEKQAKKRQEAEERNRRWSALTDKEKLAHLDALTLTAKKQRAKIANQD